MKIFGMEFYQFKCWMIQSWRFRKSLSSNFISDLDQLLLDFTTEAVDEAYKFWNDNSLEEHNKINNDKLEDLQIAKEMLHEAKSIYYGHDKCKEYRINTIEQAFKFIGSKLHKWWI